MLYGSGDGNHVGSLSRLSLINGDKQPSMALLKRFAMKYYPGESMVDAEIADAGRAAQMYVIDIEHISGKEVQEK